MDLKRITTLGFLTAILAIIIFFAGWFARDILSSEPIHFLSPLVEKQNLFRPKPLQAYAIPALATRSYIPSELIIGDTLEEFPSFISYTFSFTTMNKTMTGVINLPRNAQTTKTVPVIILIRGYVEPDQYQPGVGTKNATKYLAERGYITLSPDFFGFGGSDPEPENPWEARFIKPITVIELLRSIQTYGIPATTADHKVTPSAIGMWAHSNGGQIALNVLEILSEPIPTVLWAPVTAPFPYSVEFFSDELPDEGKEQRKWMAIFEEDYNAFDFSLTQHLDRLTGPIQIHHGTTDDSALFSWSQDFVKKVEAENSRRSALSVSNETPTAANETTIPQTLPPTEITLFSYPGADHNLQPGWDTAMKRTAAFFAQWVK